MIYLAPRTPPFFDDPQTFGCIFSTAKQVGGQQLALEAGCKWIFENGRFTGKFQEGRWIKHLESLQPFVGTCIAIIIPDRPFNAQGTLEEFWRYHHIPKMYGYKVALVTQNGMAIQAIPWNEIDVLFIGGDDKHKRGLEAQTLALHAKELGKWVHVGRCNSGGKYLKNGKVQGALLKHWTWADSADGTTLIKHPKQQLASIKSGVTLINEGNASHQLVLVE